MGDVFHLAAVPGWKGVLPDQFLNPPRPTYDRMVQSGEDYGRRLFAADAKPWLAVVAENPAFAADLMMWFAYFEVKAISISKAVATSNARGNEYPHFHDAVKAGYRDAVCELIVDQIQAWKKKALFGKIHFARTVKFMPMASQVLVFPNDPPAVDPSYRESIRVMLDSLAELAGLR